ncbi:MAG: Rne/Rng family ribonuclease [Alphaproteobacteria bacterium]|nr:Rne/Rng family ribonuclease [Alphaproteobacteria bacterium]
MTTRMLIDAGHPEETRVVVSDGHELQEFDVESSVKTQIKANIYLAKVVRIEPSLQSAFVEYGGNRHGFLPFSEIHTDYFQVPVSDRDEITAEQARLVEKASLDDINEDEAADPPDGETVPAESSTPPARGSGRRRQQDDREDHPESILHAAILQRGYRIQEVIRKNQILLIQVTKEERGTKGAALSTYLSIAGRYCVLMPNTPRGGGISRKITDHAQRRRLKEVAAGLDIPEGMGLIVRTAGQNRSRPEIRRDYNSLLKQWEDLRDKTLKSTAPCLIREEASIIKRAIRDLYTKSVEEVLVEGAEGYRTAKAYMKFLMPSHASRVKLHREPVSLFHTFDVEKEIDAMHSPVVPLASGGSLVINPTEALVVIDVNSGRSTRERSIEETALKTNLEATREIARQMRLRDLAGLVVIDFIDMDDRRNDATVERRMKEAVKGDRARIQVGRISHFGLMELSRQRMRPSLEEAISAPCPTCNGSGYMRSTESTTLHVLRGIESAAAGRTGGTLLVTAPMAIAFQLLNHKRLMLTGIEDRYKVTVTIEADDRLLAPDFRVDTGESGAAAPSPREDANQVPDESSSPRRRKRSRRRRRDPGSEADPDPVKADGQESEDEAAEQGERKRRRRGRRGGRRRKANGENTQQTAGENRQGQQDDTDPAPAAETSPADSGAEAAAG